MFYIRDSYIRDACADFKHMDGSVMQMTSNLDKIWYCDLLREEDKSVMELIGEEDEESCAIQEDNQYELISCRRI